MAEENLSCPIAFMQHRGVKGFALRFLPMSAPAALWFWSDLGYFNLKKSDYIFITDMTSRMKSSSCVDTFPCIPVLCFRAGCERDEHFWSTGSPEE